MSKLLRNYMLIFIAAGAAMSIPTPSFAKEQSEFQMFLRTGIINGKYSGVFTGEFEVGLAFDFGAEYFTQANQSVLVRFIQALDSPDSVPFYTYAGSGQRFYLNRGGYNIQSDTTTMISSRPKLRYYGAWELGVAQVIVKSFGPVIQSVANMAELGLNGGVVYQISDKIGLEAQLGGTLGFGISSTSVNGSTVRALGGFTYFF